MVLTESEVRKLLSEFIGDNKATMLGKCISVDKVNCTCVIDDDGVEVYDVRLRAITGANDGIVRYPKKDAYVLAVKIETTDEWMMIEATQYESILVLCDDVVFNSDTNGGLVKAVELKTQLDKLSKRVDDVIGAINNGVAATGAADGGAALLGTIKKSLALITDKEDFGSIENTKFKH